MRSTTLHANVGVSNGLSFCQATRFTLAMFLNRLRSTNRQRSVILGSINGNCRLTTTKVGAVTCRRIMQVMNEDSRIRDSINFDIFRVRFRRIRPIVRQRILSWILWIRNVRANLYFARNGFRFTNLGCLYEVMQACTRNRSAICCMFSWSRDRASDSFFNRFVVGQVVIGKANCSKGNQVVTITVLNTSRFLRSSNRFLLIGRITNDLRMNFAVLVVCKDVRSLSNVTWRARRFMLVIRVKGRMDKVSSNGKLMVKIFRRAKKASNGQYLRHVRRDGRVLCRPIKRLNAGRNAGGRIINHVTRNCLMRLIKIRRLIRCVNARSCNFQGRSKNVLGLVRLYVTFCRIIGRDRATSLSSRQAVASANGVKVAIRTITLRRNCRSLVLRLTMFCSNFRGGLSIYVGVLGEFPHGLLRRFNCQRSNA